LLELAGVLLVLDEVDVVLLELLEVEVDLLLLLEELLPPLLPRPPLDYTRSVSRNSSKTIFSQWCIFIFDFSINFY
jgi:hypothetical protein